MAFATSRRALRPNHDDGEGPIARRTLLWTILGVLAAILGVVVAVATTGEGSVGSQTGSQGGHIEGDNNTINNFQQFQRAVGDQPDDARIRALARRYADVEPSGQGPWPFLVTDVGQLGLIVRTSGDRLGQQIGSAGDGGTLWVDCISDTGFDPSSGTKRGSVWARIRWPNSTRTSDFFNSAPADPAQGWVYLNYLVPAGHDGHVPWC